ncbi:MAG: F0F1 ATP synthase subunit delta [Candidatus Gottesmanbacteria bacterium]|nr:F0F1 ATP synthase subunit delta [Candidatus Gottesmanbacteria bacterium]
MTSIARDARFFVDGVAKYLKTGGSGGVLLPRVTAALHKISSSASAGKTATVESVVRLTGMEKAQLGRFLSRLLTHTVSLECRTNKNLIGGIRVTVGDWVVDTSIATQIRAMQEALSL